MNNYSFDALAQPFSYNIRSWLTGISGDFFTEVLGYHSGLVPRYDGKISSISWKSGAETSLRKYELSYDNLARLVSADYSELSIPQAFDETYEYDANGNMNHILRKGLNSAGTAVTTIKNISMALTGNRMTAIGGSACSHDDKGRMTSCAYGEAWTATYNILDLPQSETVGTKSISRKYSADCIKLQEKITDGGNVATRDYVGNCIYENGVLKKVLFEGGYTQMSGSTPTYMFFLTDHLGSVRVILDDNGSVCQINQYYPFGDLMTDPRLAAGSQDNCFRYTGKELITESGQYDFGARFLSPLVGRFNTVDPLAEKYYDISPYAYCAGDPVNRVDPDGTSPQIIGALGGALVGGIVSGGIALYEGKRGRELWGAVGGGVVSGAIIGAIGGMVLFRKEFVATALEGAITGAMGSASGSVTEQLIVDQSVDMGKAAFDTVSGAIAGAGSNLFKGIVVDKVESRITAAIEEKYASQETVTTVRNEIKNELKNSGRITGYRNNALINNRTTRRINTVKSAEEYLVHKSAAAVNETQKQVNSWWLNNVSTNLYEQ